MFSDGRFGISVCSSVAVAPPNEERRCVRDAPYAASLHYESGTLANR